jgi:2-C-methyl-D-erythritol 4-phosphate cytidylyltransferase / 2-C-methyl-D-erythritol 2,4-cyclodiphosphate synthase
MKTVAILPGAGRGRRLAGDRPKAFVVLGGRTLLEHAAAAIEACPDVDAFVVAAPAGWEDRAREIAKGFSKLIAVTSGAETRQGSVHLALAEVPEDFDAVVCHDVARPLASPKLFSAVLSALDRADGVVPAVAVSDTVKRVADGVVVETLVRDELVLVQTPQAFHRRALHDAHRRAAAEGITATDDAALVERAGYRVVLVDGEEGNLKVTRPDDLRRAEALLRADG